MARRNFYKNILFFLMLCDKGELFYMWALNSFNWPVIVKFFMELWQCEDFSVDNGVMTNYLTL